MEKYFDNRLSLQNRHNSDIVWRLVAADIVSRMAIAPRSILDLGTGYGDFINQVSGEEKWAADVWQGSKKFLSSSIRFVNGDITERLPEIPGKHFDLCFMSNVLEHFSIDDALKVLVHAKEYLKEGAYLILLQPNFTWCSRNYFDDYTHKTIFTAEGLGNFLCDNGFELMEIKPRYLPFSFKSRLPRPRWAVWLYLKSPWKPMAAQMLIAARLKN